MVFQVQFKFPEIVLYRCGKRERGNIWYARQEYSLAIQCYRRALDFLDDIEGGVSLPTSDSSENKEVRILFPSLFILILIVKYN